MPTIYIYILYYIIYINHYIVSALQFEHVYTYILLDQVPASTSVCMSADMTSEYILGVPMDTYIHTNIHTHAYIYTHTLATYSQEHAV